MTTLPTRRQTIRTRSGRLADGFAIAAAVAVPWSSSLFSFLVVLWFLTLIPALDPADVRREIATAAGGLPVALFVLGALGMIWAGVSWSERLGGLDSFLKLLMIPLLLIQFRRSDQGLRVMGGYLVSCTVLLAVSSISLLWPQATILGTDDIGVPVKSAATQCSEFITCAFALLFLAIESARRGRFGLTGGLVVLALIFLINIYWVATSSTALFVVRLLASITILVLLVLLGFKIFSRRTMLGALAAVAALCAIVWISSPQLRTFAVTAWDNVQPYPGNDDNWLGSRPEFWKKSLRFISEAPILGHGTGSVYKLFASSAVGQTGFGAYVTLNPHQQTLAIGIQLGLVGMAVLWAMWIAHLMLFRGNSLPEWIGLVAVSQNVVGSLIDSTLFDFTQGWVYVLAVGVAGGMVRKLGSERAAP